MVASRPVVFRRFVTLLAVSSLAGTAWMAATSWGEIPQANPPAVGWQGILPEIAPDDLRIEEFEKFTEELPASWKSWSEETTNLVLDFFEKEYATVDEQRAALLALQRRTGTMEKALADPTGQYRNFPSIRTQIGRLYSRVAPRVDLISAILDTLTMDPLQARADRVAPAMAELSDNLSRLKSDLTSSKVSGGQAWLPWVRYSDLEAIARNHDTSDAALESLASVKNKLAARETYDAAVKDFASRPSFLDLEASLDRVLGAAALGTPASQQELRALLKEIVKVTESFTEDQTIIDSSALRGLDVALRRTAPDGGQRILSALSEHWFNYNMRIVTSEGLLKRMVADNRRETSRINECIMQAYVSGHQCTDASVDIDVQPSRSGARMQLQLNGTIQSNSNAFAGPATVHSVGYHRFTATKGIVFDGDRFTTNPAGVWAAANNQTVDAVTKYSRIPIFGAIADNIAFNEAQARQGEANAYTIQQIHSEVGSRLNREVDDQFSKASLELQNKLYGPLREQGMYPQTMSVGSTETDLIVRSRLMEKTETGGSRPIPGFQIPSNGVLVQIHESLLTNGMQRLGLDGQTMTESEVRKLLEEKFTKLLGREVDLPEPKPTESGKPQNNTLVFAEQDAVRFRIQNGEVRLVIRAGMKREGAEDIPTHVIEVPIRMTPDGDEVKTTRADEVAVRPAPGGPRIAPVEAIARQNVMRQTIQSALEDSSFQGTFDLQPEGETGKTIRLRVTSIDAEGGWLSIGLQ